MKLQNTFVQSKMNTDIDERLLPKGQYPDAVNIRVANTEGSDVGAIENVKGNEKLTDLGLTDADTIGSFADGAAQKLYWFIASDTRDLVVEYDTQTTDVNILLDSTNPDGVLNFSKDYLITGVVKIVNGDSDRDLLIWTDDLNPPRVINIKRAKDVYTTADSFDEQDISLINRAPRYAPDVTLTYTASTQENELVNKFYSFAYRYKYLDGGNSPLSSFTNYQFAPSNFDMDYQTMENRGMSNSFNAVKIDFNTGDYKVTDVELVYKESGSNTVFLIESFNKAEELWDDNVTKDFTFSNNKSLVALPQDELFRTFDNIPKKAKALELMGSRIAFGNYVEQYDLIDISGDPVTMDYSLSLDSTDITGDELTSTISNSADIDDLITIDINGFILSKGNKLIFEVDLSSDTQSSTYKNTFDFIFNKDFSNASELATDDGFKYFVETLMSSSFETNYTPTLPTGTVVTSSYAGFEITAHSTTTISIKAPVITYDVDAVPQVEYYKYDEGSSAFYKKTASDSSIKTNRSYEVGIIYIDADGRTTTVLTDPDNTLYVDQEFSTSKNKIIVDINHKPPEWADRYKLVVKQNKNNYQTIYTNLFYTDGLFRWIKLEGANIGKVAQGDTLILKSDLGGVVYEPIKVKVLELEHKDKDFITENEDSDGNLIIEESGVYMKIKPSGFDMNESAAAYQTFEGTQHLRYPTREYTKGDFGEYDGVGTFIPYKLPANSRVNIYIEFKAGGTIAYKAEYDESFRVNADYDSVKDWFDAEVIDLGQFGRDFTWNGVSSIGSNICGGHDNADGNNRFSGWGFGKDCEEATTLAEETPESFFVVAHRDGTKTRSITTTVRFEIQFSENTVIFETEPQDSNSELYYETAETYDIIDGTYHQGNLHQGSTQSQSLTEGTAIIESDFFNCYVQGNGAESYRYLDALNVGTDDDGNQLRANYLDIDLRPTTTSEERYREVRRYADITYSEPYNENTNLNGLGVFNLAKANYKEDIEKKYGFIQKLYARDTNLLVMQEDKISKVLFGKNIITNADGTSNVSTIEDVLGQQIMYTGEYGISRNPESFAFDSANVYFIDSKRGCVCRLGAQGITEISMAGMRTFFKDEFKDAIDIKKIGAYDPYLDQYVVNSSAVKTLTFDEKAKGWTSFHSYFPEDMLGMNNKFFSFQNGELYEHHSDNVDRNTYYGEFSPSKIGVMVNDHPSEIKELQAISLEGNDTWETLIKAYISNSDDYMESSVHTVEFVKKEGIWFAYARRNESDVAFDSKATYGIGMVDAVVGLDVTFNGGSVSLTVGDQIIRGSDLLVIGTVTDIVGNTITLDTVGDLAAGEYILGAKDSRIEGGNLRGYTLRMDLTNSSTEKVELFAVNAEVMKSYS